MPPLNLVVRAFETGPWRLAAICLLATLVTAAVVVQRSDQRGRGGWPDVVVGWLLWHWFTGAPLEHRAVFRHTPLPRRILLGLARTAAAGVLVVTEYLRSGSPAGTAPHVLAAVDLAGTALAGLVVWVVFFTAVEIKHYLVWVGPLHRSIHKVAGHPENKLPWTYMRIPRDRAHGRDGVIIRVHSGFDVRAKHVADLVERVTTRLDLADVKVTPMLHRRHGSVKFQPQDHIPAIARYSEPEIRDLLDKAKRSAPIMGVTTGGRPVAIDLETESPHILISAGTGGGKTALARTLVAQLMCSGATVTVIDIKRRSHQWLRRFDGVTYARDLGDIHRVLLDVAQEGHRRNKAWDDVDIDEQGPQPFTRHILLCEELNSTMGALRDWWKAYPYEGPGPKGICPSIRALGQILFMGREARVHVISIAQMATANDMGSSAYREQHFTRVLGRYSQAAARMLAPECDLPPATRHPGRVQVCIGGEHTETQAIYMTPVEARDYVAEVRDLRPKAIAGPSVARRDTPVSLGERTATVADATQAELAEHVTLQEAAAELGMTYDGLRKAIERGRETGEAPPVIGRDGRSELYVMAAIRAFLANRPRAIRPQPEAATETREVDGVDRTDQTTRA